MPSTAPPELSEPKEQIGMNPAYCLDFPLVLIMDKSFNMSGGDFTVQDLSGQVRLKTAGSMNLAKMKDTRTITDPEGNLLFTLKAHVWKQTYNFTGTNSAGEEVFKVNMGWMKVPPKGTITFTDATTSTERFIRFEGRVVKEDATFFDGDDVVAFMSRDSYKGVSRRLHIAQNVDYALIVAAALVYDTALMYEKWLAGNTGSRCVVQ